MIVEVITFKVQVSLVAFSPVLHIEDNVGCPVGWISRIGHKNHWNLYCNKRRLKNKLS